jgi:hypothetical protein
LKNLANNCARIWAEKIGDRSCNLRWLRDATDGNHLLVASFGLSKADTRIGGVDVQLRRVHVRRCNGIRDDVLSTELASQRISKAIMPPLEAEYPVAFCMPTTPASEAMNTIRPPPEYASLGRRPAPRRNSRSD